MNVIPCTSLDFGFYKNGDALEKSAPEYSESDGISNDIMEDTDEQEEDVLNGDVAGSHDKFQSSDSKTDKYEAGDDWHVKTDNEDILTAALEKGEIDSDAIYPSHSEYRRPVEIGSERLKMRGCPFFYIPDNTHKKKIAKAHSKIGSLDNINHLAGGGNKKIFSQKIHFSSVTSRINSGKSKTLPTSLPVKDIRTSGANNTKTRRKDLQPAAQVHSKIGSLKNVNHVPGGGDKKILTYRIPDYKHKVSSKLDSSDPTPSIHQLWSDIDELVCDEEIHYHSRYKHTGRPHSAPAKRLSHERPLHSFSHSGTNISDNSQDFHKNHSITDSGFKNINRDKT